MWWVLKEDISPWTKVELPKFGSPTEATMGSFYRGLAGVLGAEEVRTRCGWRQFHIGYPRGTKMRVPWRAVEEGGVEAVTVNKSGMIVRRTAKQNQNEIGKKCREPNEAMSSTSGCSRAQK